MQMQGIRSMVFGRFLFAMAAIAIMPVAFSQNATPGNDQSRNYKIQPGDLMEISVWREDYLEREVIVQPDGKISFPLVGTVNAGGTTIEAVQALVAQRLTQYIPDPVVTVSIKEIRGNRVYVLGQVRNPGQFIMNPTVDVIQALALAGGLTTFAESNEIKILRRSGNLQELIEFRYADIARGRNLKQNIVLQSGDVVIVP